MSWLPITDLFSSARTVLSFPSCVAWWFFLRNQDKGSVPHCCHSSPDTDLFSKLGLEVFVQLCCLQWFCYKVIFADNEHEFYS